MEDSKITLIIETHNKMVNDNRHGLALEFLASRFDMELSAKKMVLLNDLQDLFGELTPEIEAIRKPIQKAIYERVKKEIGYRWSELR